MVGNGIDHKIQRSGDGNRRFENESGSSARVNDHVGVILGRVAHLISKHDQRMIILATKLRED